MVGRGIRKTVTTLRVNRVIAYKGPVGEGEQPKGNSVFLLLV
jgi:hypothetical protein